MHDGRLSPRARCVAYEIARHINAVTGEAWPSQERMRKNLGFKAGSQVKRAIAELHCAEHVAIKRDHVSRSNTYVPRFEAALSLVDAPLPHRGTSAPISKRVDGGSGAPTWEQNAQIDGGTGAPQSSLRETVHERTGQIANADPSRDTNWLSIKNGLAKRLSPAVMTAWFDAVMLEAITEREIILSAPNRFQKSYIENHFAQPLFDCCKALHSSIESVRVVVLCARASS